ncbi:hypothetical protein L1887_61480 [Cichorium endivia]|nr:hypothetical protein L1887_61480 [Cichorium endivia]
MCATRYSSSVLILRWGWRWRWRWRREKCEGPTRDDALGCGVGSVGVGRSFVNVCAFRTLWPCAPRSLLPRLTRCPAALLGCLVQISAIPKGVCEFGLHARLCSTQHPHALAETRTLDLQPHSGGARPCRRNKKGFEVAASLSCSASSAWASKPRTHAQHRLEVGTGMPGSAR